MRTKRLALNTITAIINQIVVLICGFILPRQILIHYGSTVNGLVSSITQFLGFISLMDMGVGSVVQASLYKPLSERNMNQISEIVYSANRFFRKIAICLVGYTFALMIFYPALIDSSQGWLSTAILIAGISLKSVGQYYFGITNKLLLGADQKSYIYLIPTSLTNILNTFVAVILIQAGFSISTVKIVSSLVLLLCPLFLSIYVNNNYKIDKNKKPSGEPLQQKWSALSQHIATFIVDRTDVAVLTVMSTLKNVSIYDVYYLVVAGIYQTYAVIFTGVQSLLGDMYAKEEKTKLNQVFDAFEWLTHFFVVVAFGCTAVLIIPFIKVYTNGVSDVNYIVPEFSLLITAAYGFCCLYCYYNLMIKAVGHFKETQLSAIIEAILNLSISIFLVRQFGLVGVALGTLIAKIYRVLYFVIYLKKHILHRKIKHFFKLIAIDFICIAAIYFSTSCFSLTDISYSAWVWLAIKVFIIALVEASLLNVFLNLNTIKVFFEIIHQKIHKT